MAKARSHTYIYIYIYIYMSLCVCVRVCLMHVFYIVHATFKLCVSVYIHVSMSMWIRAVTDTMLLLSVSFVPAQGARHFRRSRERGSTAVTGTP